MLSGLLRLLLLDVEGAEDELRCLVGPTARCHPGPA